MFPFLKESALLEERVRRARSDDGRLSGCKPTRETAFYKGEQISEH